MQKTWDKGSIPGLRRSPGEGNGNPLQYSCLENSIDREAWRATVHGVAKSWTWLSTHDIKQVIEPFRAFFTCVVRPHQSLPPGLLWRSVGVIGRRRQWHPTPVLLPGKFHGRRSLVGYSPNQLSCVRPFVTLWTVTRQAALSLGFSRQEYRSG